MSFWALKVRWHFLETLDLQEVDFGSRWTHFISPSTTNLYKAQVSEDRSSVASSEVNCYRVFVSTKYMKWKGSLLSTAGDQDTCSFPIHSSGKLELSHIRQWCLWLVTVLGTAYRQRSYIGDLLLKVSSTGHIYYSLCPPQSRVGKWVELSSWCHFGLKQQHIGNRDFQIMVHRIPVCHWWVLSPLKITFKQYKVSRPINLFFA